MTAAAKKKLITTNAGIWVAGVLASFILPMVAKSLTDGPGNFLQMMAQVFPLIAAMLVSTAVISKSINPSSE